MSPNDEEKNHDNNGEGPVDKTKKGVDPKGTETVEPDPQDYDLEAPEGDK